MCSLWEGNARVGASSAGTNRGVLECADICLASAQLELWAGLSTDWINGDIWAEEEKAGAREEAVSTNVGCWPA